MTNPDLFSGRPSTQQLIGVSLATKLSRVDVLYSTTATILSFTPIPLEVHRCNSDLITSFEWPIVGYFTYQSQRTTMTMRKSY